MKNSNSEKLVAQKVNRKVLESKMDRNGRQQVLPFVAPPKNTYSSGYFVDCRVYDKVNLICAQINLSPVKEQLYQRASTQPIGV
ncbi:MAG: hypothetical protein ACOYI9_03045 [Candidatus Hydrogenedentales bacterium]|jgi:hypothetical protein